METMASQDTSMTWRKEEEEEGDLELHKNKMYSTWQGVVFFF